MKKRNYDYFKAFTKSAQYASEAAEYLCESLKNYDKETFKQRMDALHLIENAADDSKHEVMQHLAHEFITPIEREDIVEMIQELDNVTDAIDEAMRYMYAFNLDGIEKGAIQFAELIVECTKALEIAVGKFSAFKKDHDTIMKELIEVNRLETVADGLHLDLLHDMYADKSKDARFVMIWNTVYECLESCLDASEHVADVVESVIMKNT